MAKTGKGTYTSQNHPPQPYWDTQLAGTKIPVGIAKVVDGHGAKDIEGARGVEVDSFGKDDVGKGLDVHQLHKLQTLAGHDGAQETRAHSGHDHGFTAGHGHHEGGDHPPFDRTPAGHGHGMEGTKGMGGKK